MIYTKIGLIGCNSISTGFAWMQDLLLFLVYETVMCAEYPAPNYALFI